MAQDTTITDKKTIQVTQEGLDELKEELAQLKTVKLPAVIERVATARSYGDLKENAEYHAAKEEQDFVETRIDKIEEIIGNAQVVKQTRSQTKVGMGSQVKVTKKGQKTKTLTFQLVGEYESEPEEGKISAASPLGKALLGKKKGDKITVTTPGGEVEYELLEIK